MPTQLAQLGSVAKTQAQAQQSAQPASQVSEQLNKQDDLKAQRVKEINDAEKGRINGDEDRRQKRKKRRHQKNQLKALSEDEIEAGAENQPAECTEEEEIGRLVDLRA